MERNNRPSAPVGKCWSELCSKLCPDRHLAEPACEHARASPSQVVQKQCSPIWQACLRSVLEALCPFFFKNIWLPEGKGSRRGIIKKPGKERVSWGQREAQCPAVSPLVALEIQGHHRKCFLFAWRKGEHGITFPLQLDGLLPRNEE